MWAYEWGGDLHASFGTSSSCGTVILVSPRQAGSVIRVETDHEGRLVCILLKYPQGNVSLCNVYAPNRSLARRDFFETLSSFVPGSTPCIMAGDFNCVPDIGLDRRGSSVAASPDAGIKELNMFVSAHNLADVWRNLYPRRSVFTWVRPNGADASRIDRVYAPHNFQFVGCDMLSCPFSDHDAIVARFVLPSIFPVGRDLWKLNCQILGEKEFRQGFETRYKGWQSLKPAFASISQWWDDVKLRIKRYAIEFCVTRARRRRENFLKLCADVKRGAPSAAIALQKHLDEKYHGARVRARVQAVEAEERPSLRFYQFVASSAVDRRVPAVRDECGNSVNDPHGIVRVFQDFYSKLFTRDNVDLTAQADLLAGLSKTVPDDVNELLGGEITTVELWKALSKMKNGKSPGSDGLPREFYRTFWAIIGQDVRAVFDSAFQNGLLNESQRLGMITLLPKSGDPLDPRNKRPITLLTWTTSCWLKYCAIVLPLPCRILWVISRLVL